MTGACCQLPSHEGRYLRGVGMSIFRCDFAVESDMILLDDAAATQTRLSSGHELFIRNAAPDIAGNVAGLVCSVIGDAPDIENVHQLLRDELAEFLDLLAFVTQSRFEITKVDRVRSPTQSAAATEPQRPPSGLPRLLSCLWCTCGGHRLTRWSPPFAAG